MKPYILPPDDRMFRPHSSTNFVRPMASRLRRFERRHKLFAGLALIGLAMVISWGLS